MSMTSYSNYGRATNGSRDILAISRFLMLFCLAAFACGQVHAQAIPTASAGGVLQIGAMFNLADPDYSPETFKGYGFYSTFDFTNHYGI